MADSFTIRIDGIDSLLKAPAVIKAYVEGKASELLTVLLEDGEDYAANLLGHIDTGETLSSIVAYRNGRNGVIVANGAAIWIEFGTGVARNNGNVHPPVVEDNVGIVPHGTYGQGKGANPKGWYYKGDDGQIHHTLGIRGNRFMYNTYEELVRRFPDIAKEVFSK